MKSIRPKLEIGDIISFEYDVSTNSSGVSRFLAECTDEDILTDIWCEDEASYNDTGYSYSCCDILNVKNLGKITLEDYKELYPELFI